MNVLLAGVGGQGVVLVSKILAIASIRSGIDVRVGEKHGLAQRGGSVTSHLRLNSELGVIIPKGRGDILLGFEPLEAYRNIEFMSKDSLKIVNENPIFSPSNFLGTDPYPQIDWGEFSNLFLVNIDELSEKIKLPKSKNIMMLGFLFNLADEVGVALPIPEEIVREVVKENAPKGTAEQNLFAFEEGKRALFKSVEMGHTPPYARDINNGIDYSSRPKTGILGLDADLAQVDG